MKIRKKYLLLQVKKNFNGRYSGYAVAVYIFTLRDQ